MNDIDSTIASVSVELAAMAAKGIAISATNRFKSIRDKQQLDEVCNSYEELINELVADRARAIAIAQAYQAELDRYHITDEDIDHLQNTVDRVLEIMKEYAGDTSASSFEQFKSIISKDTLKSMQLLGFDYKAAIGDPLTKCCAAAIESKLMPRNNGRQQTAGRNH